MSCMSYRIHLYLLVFVTICACTVLASAQVTSLPTELDQAIPATSSAVAYVYVSNAPSTVTDEIYGYSVASNGALTALSGSPWHTTDSYMALNGAWLFSTDGVKIDSWSIGSNGALALADTYNAGNGIGGPIDLVLDHTGTDLYVGYVNMEGMGGNGYQAYSINQSTGQITFLDSVGDSANVISFVGNNQYAYTSNCDPSAPGLFGFQRYSTGSISQLNLSQVYPMARSGDFYCPFLAAADSTNHLAIAVQPYSGFGSPVGPYQLATYTVNSAGNVSTKSTYSNMPSMLVGSLNDYNMSPSGKYLAVGGGSGLQIFHFNGANPITKFTGRLTAASIDQMFWDNASHLYAISRNAGKLFVYTVTSTGVTQAPGSPHTIANPLNIVVLPKS